MEQQQQDTDSIRKELSRATTPSEKSYCRELSQLSYSSRPITPSATSEKSSQSRPTTPKWWRPNYPPKTYYWEEIRRKIRQGGYPWNYLDKEDRDTFSMGDNLYEPVNPRPYYGSGNMYDPETTSLDDRLIEIPPELDIITSEGLDGLDKRDKYDFGFDGDREWRQYHEETGTQEVPVTKTFTAGIRQELPKFGETSSERPLMTKTAVEDGDQTVPDSGAEGKPNAFEVLKNKAGQVKKQLSKISLPAKPKWTGIKLTKKKSKEEEFPVDDEEEIVEQVPIAQQPSQQSSTTTPTKQVEKVKPPLPPPPKIQSQPQQFSSQPQPQPSTSKAAAAIAMGDITRPNEEIIERPRSQATSLKEDKTILDAEAAAELLKEVKSEEKRKKEQIEEELKRKKLEEKTAKEKSQEELKKQKAEEKAAKDKLKEEKKKAEAEDKLLRKMQDEELKKAKAEELRKAQEEEEERRKKMVVEVETPSQVEEKKAKAKAAAAEMADALSKQKQLEQDKKKLEKDEKKKAQEYELKSKRLEQSIQDEIINSKERQEEEDTSSPAAATVPSQKEKILKKADAIKRKLSDIDFTKRFKRSKTPPATTTTTKTATGEKPKQKKPPRLKFTPTGYTNDDTDNKLAAQYAQEILKRDAEMEADIEKGQIATTTKLHEPIIYVTQPSVETASSESRSAADLNKQQQQLYYENLPAHEVAALKAQQEQQLMEEEEEGGKPKFAGKMKGIASEKSKVLGNRMKLFGHDLKQFGGKVNVRCKEHIKEFKATQEAAKKRSRELKDEEDERKRQKEESGEIEDKPEKAPRTSFRFKKRPLNDQDTLKKEETEAKITAVQRKKKPSSQEPAKLEGRSVPQEQEQVGKIKRNEVLGNAERDWESPLDLIQSRDQSEEPFSGRYSPPGSSTASSRRQGVLEEIDSDEFFLRERGISEGEDEEEVNRLLMHELRQTFRPMNNALRGFDMPSPPPRPPRSPRKPQRKSRRNDGGGGGGGGTTTTNTNFQTFPPERPKRKQTPGYISAYLNQTLDKPPYEVTETPLKLGDEEEDEFMALESDEEEEEEDEGIRRVKLELRRIDQDLEDDKIRFEPVLTETPSRPGRAKKDKQIKNDGPQDKPQIFYYNTIGANEWIKEIEGQIEKKGQDKTTNGLPPGESSKFPPVAPKRIRRKSDGGKSWKSDGGKSGKSETQSDIDNTTVGLTLTGGGSSSNQDEFGSLSIQVDQSEDSTTPTAGIFDLNADDIEYVDYDEDEPGYAVVQKKIRSDHDLPKTVPRKKRRDKSKKGNSLKRRSQEGEGSRDDPQGTTPVFCSLPRYTPRTFHIVPPTRPHRNYSSLRPRRPPRHQKSPTAAAEQSTVASASQGSRSPRIGGGGGGGMNLFEDRERPSSGGPNVGSIQERPLPPPPRPQRSPIPMNDLDHTSIERMVGTRHYANYTGETDEQGRVPVVEELFVAKNIPLLGGEDDDLNVNESNIGIQTDPVHGEEEFDLNAVGSFEEEDSSGTDKLRDSAYPKTSSGPQETRQIFRDQSPRPPLRQEQTNVPAPPVPATTQVIFPNRLHLDELEVDFLRVNELTAQSITMDHLHSPNLYVDSLSSSGALVVPLIQSSNLAVDQVNTERLSANDTSMPSIPPASFYQLSSPLLSQEESAQQRESLLTRTSLLTQQQQQQQRGQQLPPATGGGSRRSSDDVLHLTARLGRAIFHTISRGLDSLTDFLDTTLSTDPECQAKQRSQIQILLCLLLVLIVGIFLMSGGESPSTQRWEFFLPPPDL